jgi:propionyl-CoA carboxylase alpha chain
LDEATRQKMGEQSCALARAVDYQSAGTVEFIADANMNFYFLEMNTRLQVEHPVTELVTGQDLVEMMIRVAAGEKLSITQDQVKLTGWAMESRVYAEDPFRNFMPSIGRLSGYREPEGEGVRVDSGVYEGGEVSMHYDPMISKLITYGDNRTQAIDRMVDALDAYYIRGVNHNISFLNALMVHPRFVAGELTTNFIAEEFPDGFNADLVPQSDPAVAVVVAASVHQEYRERSALISGQTGGRQYDVPCDWVVIASDTETPVTTVLSEQGFLVSIGDKDYEVATDWALGEPLFQASINGRSVCVQVARNGSEYKLFYRGAEINALVLSPKAAKLNKLMLEKIPADLSRFLLSPMPGLLVKLAVKVGDQVKAGEELAVVEAMKMENSLRAIQDGIVAKISAETGDSLMVDQTILEFE